MSTKQVIKALQHLLEEKLIPLKLFRQLIDEFHDDRLSWSAKGLLTYCKKHAVSSLDELIAMCNQTDESEQSVKKALSELKTHGYLEEFPELSKFAD
jgi:hypothetical protein